MSITVTDESIKICISDKIFIGGVYTLDKENKRGVDSTHESRVIALFCLKKRLFKPNVWVCCDVDDYIQSNGNVDESMYIKVLESSLHPCNTTLIRYNPSTPTFSIIDLKRLDNAINMINRIQNDKNSEAVAKSLNALREKIELTVKMREV